MPKSPASNRAKTKNSTQRPKTVTEAIRKWADEKWIQLGILGALFEIVSGWFASQPGTGRLVAIAAFVIIPFVLLWLLWDFIPQSRIAFWIGVGTASILLVSLGTIAWNALPITYGHPASFSASAPWGFWSKGETDRAAGWFAYVPDKRVTVAANVSVFVRVFNEGSRPLWIERCEAIARVSSKWVKILPMADEDSGEEFYMLPSGGPYAVGWRLSQALDFGVETESPILPGHEVKGWIFFAYPTDYDYVSQIKISVVDRTGAKVDVLLDPTPTDQITMHGPQFPSRFGTPRDFRKIPVVKYASIVSR